MMKKMLALLMLAGLSGIAQAKMVKEQAKEQKKESSEAVECLVNELPQSDQAAKDAVKRKRCKCFCCVTTNKLLVNGDATITGTLTANNLVADIESVSGDFSVGGTLTLGDSAQVESANGQVLVVNGDSLMTGNLISEGEYIACNEIIVGGVLLNGTTLARLIATLSGEVIILRQATTGSVISSPNLAIVFPFELTNAGGITYNTGVFTVPVLGNYQVTWTFPASAVSSASALSVFINSVSQGDSVTVVPGQVVTSTEIFTLAASDTVELRASGQVIQNSAINNAIPARFSIELIQ